MRSWILDQEQTRALRDFLKSYPPDKGNGKHYGIVDVSDLRILLPLVEAEERERNHPLADTVCPEFRRDFIRAIRGFGWSKKYEAHIGSDLDGCPVCCKAINDNVEADFRAMAALGKDLRRSARLASVRYLADKGFKPNIIPSKTRRWQPKKTGFWPF